MACSVVTALVLCTAILRYVFKYCICALFLLLHGSNVFTFCLLVMVLNRPFFSHNFVVFFAWQSHTFFSPFFLLQGSNLFLIFFRVGYCSFLLLSKALNRRGEKRV